MIKICEFMEMQFRPCTANMPQVAIMYLKECSNPYTGPNVDMLQIIIRLTRKKTQKPQSRQLAPFSRFKLGASQILVTRVTVTPKLNDRQKLLKLRM
jgi:hypothetical protein